MKRILLLIVIFIVGTGMAFSQVSLTNAAPTATIDFSSTMQTTVGTAPGTAFTGAGFAPAPAAGTYPGRLNSNAWETKGWSNGDLSFGGNMTNPAHGRGSVAAAVITEGIYAYTDTPASVANPTLMIQPGDAEFAPGSLTLRIKNNGTANMTQLTVSYNLFIRNDENSSNSFNFSHSSDNITFQNESTLDYTSPATADAFQWVLVDVSPSRSLVISGINVAPGAYYYIRWSCEDVVLSGGRDEFGLDDIVVTGTYGSPAPEINVIGNSLSILSGDMTPWVSDGTQFANTFTGGSLSLIDYYIENVGGMPLTVSGVTITGANPSDFVVQSVSLGAIPAVAGSVVSKSVLTIKFTPGAPGTRSAIINIANNDSNENPYTFMVQGLGVVPQPDMEVKGDTSPNTSPIYSTNMIPVTTNCTMFAPQIVGGPGQTLNYKIKNTGTAAILILTNPSPYITITGANPSDFTLTTIPTGPTMGNGFTKTFAIKFAPTAAGIRSAIVSIPNNDVLPDVFGNSENPYTFLIQGTGVAPEIDISGNTQPIVDGSTTPAFANHTFFDYLNIGATLDRVYTIKNTGSMALTVGALTLSGSSDFAIISPPAASVPIGGTTTFTVRFSPASSGVKTATVNLVNNDPNENPYDFVISGVGLDYTPCSYGAVETIAVQDFEVAPATPTWTYSTTGTSSLNNGVGFGFSGDGGLSDRFLGGRSLQVTNSTATVTLSAVNTLQYSDIELNLRLASLGVSIAEGNDATDKVAVSVSANGGTTWSNELEVKGNSDSKWSFSSGSGIATTVYDANNVATVFTPAVSSFATSDGFSTISITGLPKVAGLMVRVTINNNSVNEIWSLDNISLFGRKEIFSVWDGSTWSNGIPTATVKAIINGNYNTATEGNLQACKCQINAGKNVTIQSNQFFNIQSDLENLGTITIENGGSLVQRNDLAVNAGNIIVKRYTTPMTRYDYTYWSSPVSGQTLFNLSPLTLSDKFFAFDPVINNWQNVASSTMMAAGKGYIVRAPQNFSTSVAAAYTSGQFAGLTNNGFIQTPVVIGAGTWNLLGNPYPSAIDADVFLGLPANAGVIGGTIYLWTHNTPIANNQYTSSDYASYNKTGGVGTAASTSGVNPTIPTGNIASGQGFFIAGLSNGQATFNNSMRLTGFNMEFFRPSAGTVAAPAGIAKHRIWLDLSGDQGGFKQALVGYIEGATNEPDRNYDGPVLEGGNPVSIYSMLNGEPMSIQGRALPFLETDTVDLGYRAGTDGNYTISIEKVDGLMIDQAIFLEDKQLNIIHDLKSEPYVFTSSAGTFDNRFVLRYTDEQLGTVDYSIGNNDVVINVRDRKINVRSLQDNISEIKIFDLVGRQLFVSRDIHSEEFSINDVTTNQQALIVKIKLESGKIVDRKIIL